MIPKNGSNPGEELIMVDNEFLSSADLERLTGTRASTWRYWASIGQGPASFRLGRRRVWRKAEAMSWLAEQEAVNGTGRGAQ